MVRRSEGTAAKRTQHTAHPNEIHEFIETRVCCDHHVFCVGYRVRVCARIFGAFILLIRIVFFWIRFAIPQASQEQVVIVADRNVVLACILQRVLYSSVSRK